MPMGLEMRKLALAKSLLLMADTHTIIGNDNVVR